MGGMKRTGEGGGEGDLIIIVLYAERLQGLPNLLNRLSSM